MSKNKQHDLAALQHEGWRCLQAGQLARAQKAYRKILALKPDDAEAHFNLGNACQDQHSLDDAAACFRRTIALQPGHAAAHYNLAIVLQDMGHLQVAAARFLQVIALQPHFADAHFNLGDVQLALGQPGPAEASFRQALAIQPVDAEAHHKLGLALQGQDKLAQAVQSYQRAITIQPALFMAHYNMGVVLHELGRFEQAAQSYRRALAIKPDFAEAHYELGVTLSGQGWAEDAVQCYRRALALKPDHAEAHLNLSIALREPDQVEESLACCDRALALRPDFVEVYVQKAFKLCKLQQFDESLACCDRALALRPDFDRAFMQRAGTLLDMGHQAEALDTYRQGLALKPDELFESFDIYGAFLFALNYQIGSTPETMLAEACAFGERVERKAAPFLRSDHSPDPDRRLRIGLVSGDLGQHSVGFFLQNVVESLDPDKLEVFAYATAGRKDALNERLRRSIPHWRDVHVKKLSDEALANTIRADGIDILIDLAGHTGNNRLTAFAWKPAPVQVSWLGYLGTTGLSAMDYILADAWALPVGEEAHFTETPWRLPETYICFSPPDLAVEVEPLPALDKGYITFGCFNNLNKINDQVVACWARALQAVPDARLYLKTKNLGAPDVREKLVARFVRFGIAPERLILEDQFASHEEHFRAYRQVDIALDPFPYPGITTSVEALWMGVPVLSMKGQRFISHQGETILNNLGLPEWVAADEDDYVAKAAAFAGDIQALAALRAGLRERLLTSPLCDAPRFSRNLEAAFRGMWRKWCAQQKPPEAVG